MDGHGLLISWHWNLLLGSGVFRRYLSFVRCIALYEGGGKKEVNPSERIGLMQVGQSLDPCLSTNPLLPVMEY